MIKPIDECIYEIDDILFLLIKGDKWRGLANRMTKLLIQKWDEEQKEAIRDAIRFLTSEKSDTITKEEFNLVKEGLENKLGARLAEVFRKDVQKIQLESYKKGHTGAGVDFEFNAVDKKSLMWLFEKDVKQFWIGESYTPDLNEKLNNIAAEVLKAGLGREEAALLFKSKLGEQFKKTDNYWELMSEHIVTRSREFGRTSSYEKAGIEYIQIKAIIDRRTSNICRELNGRIIEVSKVVDQRNKLLRAKSIDEVKKIAPWYNEKQIQTKIKDKPTEKLPSGIGLPPYHGFCFPQDTLIRTDRGTKKICDITKRDIVLTHKKNYKHVENVFSRDYVGSAIRMNNHLTCTPEHPILVKRDDSFSWMHAKDIVIGDKICRLKRKE